MKKLAIIAILAAASIAAAAQPRAIGGRLGWGIGLSYQHCIGSKAMLEADLDLAGFNRIQLMGTFSGIIPITSNRVGELNLYAGGGIGGGYRWSWWSSSYLWSYYNYGRRSGYGFVGVAGIFGAEYNFKSVPIQPFADFRPLIGPRFNRDDGVGFYFDGLYNATIGVRFQLGCLKKRNHSSASSSSTSRSTVGQTATVTGNVNFRKGPSTSDAIIKQLQKGDTVTLTGAVSGSWTQVTHNGVKGWVSTEYLRKR